MSQIIYIATIHTGLHNKYFKFSVSLDPDCWVKFLVISRQMTAVMLIMCFSRQILIHEVSLN